MSWCLSRTQLSLWRSVLTKIVNDLLFSRKISIINVRLGSKYPCVACKEKRNKISYMKNIKLYVPFLWMGFQLSQGYRAIARRQSTSAEWKAQITLILKPPSRFEPGPWIPINPALTTRIIEKTYLKCRWPVFISIKETLQNY